MRILAGSRSLQKPQGPFAVALGIFDGVHLGHQALLERAADAAAKDGLESLVYTFHPHPTRVLVPGRGPKLIEPIEMRLEKFEKLGLSATMAERFDRELASIPADEFVRTVLVEKLGAKHVIVGAGFSFGAGGKGDTHLLEELGRVHGFTLHAVDPVILGGEVVSSTRIRREIAGGNVTEAKRLMGRPYTLTGTVRRGLMRGQKLGFPTANLKPLNEQIPAHGVYAARAEGTLGSFEAVVNVGTTPTFTQDDEIKIEAHLLGLEFQPLYGSLLSIEFIERLRGEKRFDGPESLKTQIAADILQAQQILTQSSRSCAAG